MALDPLFALIADPVGWWPQTSAPDLVGSSTRNSRRSLPRKNVVPVVNLAGQFVEKDTPPKNTYGKYFIPGDFHWNDEGNRKVAEILAPQVLEKNDIGFSRKSRYIKL
jgi:hypothetical protein